MVQIDQAARHRPGSDLGARVKAEPVQYVAEVILGSAVADHQAFGDLTIALPVGNECRLPGELSGRLPLFY